MLSLLQFLLSFVFFLACLFLIFFSSFFYRSVSPICEPMLLFAQRRARPSGRRKAGETEWKKGVAEEVAEEEEEEEVMKMKEDDGRKKKAA